MAKLNVKVVNENTVEYNGFVYELVTDGGRVNDLIQCFEDDAWLIYGEFYHVYEVDGDGDMVFNDEEEDSRYRNSDSSKWKVFRKSNAITNDKLTDAEGVVKIELPDGTKLEGTPSDLEKITRSMQALQNEQQRQAEQVATMDMPVEAVEVEDEGEKVSERLQVGDYAKVITHDDNGQSKFGDIVEVTEDDESNVPFDTKHLDGSYAGWHYENDLVRATEDEVKAVTEPKVEPLKVGDYAKVVGSSHSNYFGGKDGDIVKIVKESDDTFETQELNGGIYGCNQYALKSALVKATDEEVLEAKQALLKVNDYAKVISNEATTKACGPHEFEVGTVLKLHEFDSDDNTFGTRYLDGDTPDAEWVHRKDLEPLTVEEAEHIAREAEEEKKAKAEREKWADIGREIGELRKGDLVKWKGKYYDVNEVAPTHRKSTGTAFCCHDEGVTLGEDEDWAASINVELIVPVEQRFDTVG
ncbi:hypothetical protein ACE41I_17570 [Bacillus cereus]